MRKKRLLFIVLCILILLGVVTFFGDNGILHLLQLKKELAGLREKNLRMEEENRKLQEEVRKLQREKRYIEEIARRELGMVKKGEIIYQFEFPADAKEKEK